MKISLESNHQAVPLNSFVERLIGNLLWGVLASLHLPEGVQEVEFQVGPEGLHIMAAGNEVQLMNLYVKNTVADLLRILLKNLKGLDAAAPAIFRLNRGD